MSGGGGGGGMPQNVAQRPAGPGGKPMGPPPPNTNMGARPDKFGGGTIPPNTNVGVWHPGPMPGQPYAPPTRGGPDPQRPGTPMPPTPMPGGMMLPRFYGASGTPMAPPGAGTGNGVSAPMPYPTYRGGIGQMR